MGELILQALMPEQIVTVLAVGVKVENLEALLDAHLEHRLSFRAEMDACSRVDQLAETRIISSGNCFVVNAHGVNGAV
jgi:hypothetical protein